VSGSEKVTGSNTCGSGRTEYVTSGIVTSSSSTAAHYYDKVSVHYCYVTSSEDVSLVSGTKALL
jgi:hypothetical protein